MRNKEMEVVKELDLKKYMGRRYEIASFTPPRFQTKNGANTRATYTLKEDETVKVVNETWSDGKKSSIEGVAYKAEPSSQEAKFKVKFYVPPFLPIIPVIGNYWVLYIDQDYHYVLLGESSMRYLGLPTTRLLKNNDAAAAPTRRLDRSSARCRLLLLPDAGAAASNAAAAAANSTPHVAAASSAAVAPRRFFYRRLPFSFADVGGCRHLTKRGFLDKAIEVRKPTNQDI